MLIGDFFSKLFGGSKKTVAKITEYYQLLRQMKKKSKVTEIMMIIMLTAADIQWQCLKQLKTKY